jgi:hypothetical protein
MREIRSLMHDVDSRLEDAARAKHQIDLERWREDVRPRALRRFAARAAHLKWSRTLVKLVVEELFPDDLFTDLVGDLDRVPPRRWPGVLAIALALRHSWRRDGLSQIARALHVSLGDDRSSTSVTRPSRGPFSGSSHSRQGASLRSARTRRRRRP